MTIWQTAITTHPTHKYNFTMQSTDNDCNETSTQSDYLFVYGTLRSGCESNAHKEYLRGADFVSPAKIRGQLFMVDYYPGLVLSDAEEWTLGEIYLLGNEAQLHELDVYEGCAKKSPQPHAYKRRMTEVMLSSGETLNAWAYIYQQDTSQLETIDSGDFLNRY